jgi:hypothetical protein
MYINIVSLISGSCSHPQYKTRMLQGKVKKKKKGEAVSVTGHAGP